MSNCIKIRTKETGDYFSMFPKFQLRETKQLTQLVLADKLRFDFTVGVEFPDDPHNARILKKYFNANIVDNNYDEIEVEVFSGSHIFTENELYIKTCASGKITADLRLSVDHWGRGAKNLKLQDLPYPDVQTTCDWVKLVNSTQYPYVVSSDFNSQTNQGIYIPYVKYGRTIGDPFNSTGNSGGRNNGRIVPIEYARPWHYATGILQRGLCVLGWQLKSPLFEAELGRKIIAYVFDRKYGLVEDTETTKTDLSARGHVGAQYFMPFPWLNGTAGTVRFPNIDYDATGSLSPIDGIYVNGGEINVSGKVVFEPGIKDIDIRIALVRIGIQSGTGGTLLATNTIETETFERVQGEVTWEFDVKNISTTRQDRLAIMLWKSNQSSFMAIKPETFIEIEGVRTYFKEGKTENLGKIIDGEYTFLKFIKGLSAALNLRFKTDWGRRTVEIYQPYRQNMFGEDVEGFYIEETIEDIEALINPKSKKVTTPAVETPRVQKILFKETTDKEIEELELVDELWSIEVDLGEKFTLVDETEIRNPFFEPSYSNQIVTSRTSFIHSIRIKGDIEHPFNIGPRIALAHGNVEQDPSGVRKPTLRYCTWDDPQTSLIPTASQFTSIPLGQHNVIGGPVAIPDANLIYAVNEEVYEFNPAVTLYNLVYKRWLFEQLNNLTLDYLVELSQKNYLSIDFRKYYSFVHMGRYTVSRMDKVTDYHWCGKLQTPVTFIPLKQESDPCFETGSLPASSECLNYPLVLCSFTDPCFLFTIGGQIFTPIDNVVFETSLDLITWTPATVLTPISAEICSIFTDFYVRATVTFVDDECPFKVTSPKLVEPCPNMNLVMECIHGLVVFAEAETPTVRPRIQIPDGFVPVIVSAEVQTNGGGYVPYAATFTAPYVTGPHQQGGPNIDFRIVLQFGGCAPVQLDVSCVNDNLTNVPCADILVELDCVIIGVGQYKWNRVGVIPYDFDDVIKYRTSVDGITYTEWAVWDRVTTIAANFAQARWFVHFCDDVCPMKCSPIAQCP